MGRIINQSFLLSFIALISVSFITLDWGFYAHRKINYYAVLSVPPPLNQFFKNHVDYLREHAVDPDKRRYAMAGEGVRHFIDIDRWYKDDSCVLSKDYTIDRILNGHWLWSIGDSTVVLKAESKNKSRIEFTGAEVDFTIDSFALRQEIYPAEMDSVTLISTFLYPDQTGQLSFVDSFSQHGMVPYFVESLYARLVSEMQEKNVDRVLTICSDLGHYIADAHVPLHTTSNYNGQFSDQIGIHAFWESRIPELFQETNFNSMVGRAEYIDNVQEFVWRVAEHSYSLVSEVLEKEKIARRKVSEQNHYCYEERGNVLIRTQCAVLAREYMNLMDGMVQDQWRSSIHSISSIWYSAWIDAGQPELWRQSVVVDQDTNILDKVWEKLRRSTRDIRNGLH